MLHVLHNFGQETQCPLCKIGDDNQKHLLECMILKMMCPEILNNKTIIYSDLFGENIKKTKCNKSIIRNCYKKTHRNFEHLNINKNF